MQFIADKLQPFNACTQQFIVRLCRKMSNTWQQLWGVVRAQFKARLQPDLLQAPDTLKEGGDTKGKQSRHALVAGYIYMSLVGAMLYAEVGGYIVQTR